MAPAHDDDVPQTEDALIARVDKATQAVRRATAERDRLFTISQDVGNTPDGAVAIQQAARIQREALRRLRDALRDLEAFNQGLEKTA